MDIGTIVAAALCAGFGALAGATLEKRRKGRSLPEEKTEAEKRMEAEQARRAEQFENLMNYKGMRE